MSRLFSLILCTDVRNGIGRNNSIPWHLPEDLMNFKRLTQNNIVVMGRNTWDSLPLQPLPNRTNIIISSSLKNHDTEDVMVFRSIEEMIFSRNNYIENNKRWFIIGGSTLYNYFLHRLHLLDVIYWTHLHKNYKCDTKLKVSIHDLPYNWVHFPSDESTRINEMIQEKGLYYEIYNMNNIRIML
jgi:dihydrofolate reductase